MNGYGDKVEESFCYVRILDRTNYKGKKEEKGVGFGSENLDHEKLDYGNLNRKDLDHKNLNNENLDYENLDNENLNSVGSGREWVWCLWCSMSIRVRKFFKVEALV